MLFIFCHTITKEVDSFFLFKVQFGTCLITRRPLIKTKSAAKQFELNPIIHHHEVTYDFKYGGFTRCKYCLFIYFEDKAV